MDDLILRAADLDWTRVLASWKWLLKERYTLWGASLLGDLFLLDERRHVYLLDSIGGDLRELAPSVEAFEARCGDSRNAEDWLMADFVHLLRERGARLAPGQCYGWKIHPLLGGKLESANLEPIDFIAYNSIAAALHENASKSGPSIDGILVDGNRPS